MRNWVSFVCFFKTAHGGIPCKTDGCQWVTPPGCDYCIQPECKIPWHHVVVSGKWFNYGVIFIVMIFDGMMTKNQILYRPKDNGQYTDPGPIGEKFEIQPWPTHNHPRKIPWTKYVRSNTSTETEWEEVRRQEEVLVGNAEAPTQRQETQESDTQRI